LGKAEDGPLTVRRSGLATIDARDDAASGLRQRAFPNVRWLIGRSIAMPP